MRWLPAIAAGVLLAVVVSVPRSNPSASDEAAEFHGDADLTRRLSTSQRRGMPAEVVELGKAKEVVYEAPEGSNRRGLWRHKFGQRGPLLVADPSNQKIGLVQGASRFDPRLGVVG